MNAICNHCINKEQCSECDKKWKDKFVPSDEVKHYFSRWYCSSGPSYHFNTTNPDLVPTHSIVIGWNDHYCPYCGEKMFVIQDKETLKEIGYCCICEGARAELDYENKKVAIQLKYEKMLADELSELRGEYADKLSFCSEKLFEIKQKKERERFESSSRNFAHFSTLNGKIYHRADEMFEL